MAGIESSEVYLPTPVQTETVGAVAVAPVGTELPTTASEELSEDWDSGGFIGEEGIEVSTNMSADAIKDWSQSQVRSALSDFAGQITVPFLQIDQFAAARLVGEDHIKYTPSDGTHGNVLSIDMSAELPPIESWCFSMKDGDARVRVVVPRGQVTTIDAVQFVPNAANSWPATVSCYTADDGEAIRVIYEDGTVITGTTEPDDTGDDDN